MESIDTALYPPWYNLIFKSIWRYIPESLLYFVRYLPTGEYRRYRRYTNFMRKFSQGLVEKSMINGDGEDIMSVLLRANASENPEDKLTDSEVIDQIKYV